MQRKFERVAIVNRGEAAMRFIHAVREFNQEDGASLRAIALYTDPDRNAMFVRQADEAVALGAPQIADPITNHRKSCYVDYAHLERALRQAKAEAVWVGWGFVAEHAQFADLCRNMGIVFIGPDGDVMRRLGDKISSKRLAEDAQIEVADWSGGPVETLSEAWKQAQRLGYPVFIKATAGGGGHGIRRVQSPGQLDKALASARGEAFKAFGDPTVFLEKCVSGARHVEVQIIADHHGTTWAVGVRDCTIQRRQQKILEEAPSPVLTREQDQELRRMAVRISQSANYHNAGTVEFLYEPKAKRFLFMEMNTRLQVEHPVSECTTGLDLVKLQIRVAQGERLQGHPPLTVGHAIEVRLNAEDPGNGFAPAPGVVERFRIPTGPGVRIDTGVEEGDSIPADFDSMIAKIIAYGHDRKEALARLKRVLQESVVVIKGGSSNRAFLLDLLQRKEVQRSKVDIGWMDRLTAKGKHISRRLVDVALLQAAIEAYEAELRVERSLFYASALRGRPQVRDEIGHKVELRCCEHAYAMQVYHLGLRQYRIEVDGASIDASVDPVGPFERWLTISGQRFHVIAVEQGASFRIEVDGVSHRIDRDDGGIVRAPSPAVVVSIAVKPGDMVSTGDRLAVIEAMKMEMQVVAPFPGKIRQVIAIPNVQVSTGDPLLQIDPSTGGRRDAKAATERVSFTANLAAAEAESGDFRSRKNLCELRQLMLGFDVTPERASRVVAEFKQSGSTQSHDEETRRSEDDILNIFVDLWSLFRRKPRADHQVGGESPSTEAYLFSYLRALDSEGEGLPADFILALKRAVAHYGVTTLHRSPELEEALLAIYKSHQKAEQLVGPILGLLERRLALSTDDMSWADEEFHTLLDQLVSLSRELFPSLNDRARELRFRCFEQPFFEGARRQVYAAMAEHLDHLAAHPEALDLQQRLQALVECPQPLAGLLATRFPGASLALRQIMMRALATRYYRHRLNDVQILSIDSQCVAKAEYDEEGKHVHVFMAYAEYPRLDESIRTLFPLLVNVPVSDSVGLDFFTWTDKPLPEPERSESEIKGIINAAEFPRPIDHVVVAIAGTNSEPGTGGMQHFTYEPGEGGYEEVQLFRGVHPMMGERLHLWRLKNFKIDRLPSADDVYLLHAVAHENPKDERLFAVAEVRDLTPVRDKRRRIIQLPHLERMFSEAVAAIRQYQMRRSQRERLYWNRIFLYVWPTLRLTPDEVNDIVHRLAPMADGLGLEQVVVRMRIPNARTGELRDTVMRISAPGDAGLLMTFRPANKLQPLKRLNAYEQKVIKMRQRGLLYPFEIIKMLTPPSTETQADFPPGEFVEHDLDSNGGLAPVDRPYGQNTANIIVGTIRNFTDKHPEGMKRVALLGDPSKDLGALAEPECRRILAALDLAQAMHVPLEWYTLSAGAKISMNSGVENMDWIALVLRSIIDFTQGGGEINLIVNGINVGAQPYWNAEATMLMHTRGILIMTPKAAMVLTGKRALDYSGSVSAEDNQGIGGYDRIMGFNGQAQYFARDINGACQILMQHYEHTYIAPGERFPRRSITSDPFDRDVQTFPHSSNGEGFARVGDIFSNETNPGRKASFEIRKVMRAVSDQDHAPLERWAGLRSAETAVVWDAHLGGYPVCMLGIESQPISRIGFVPADGPDHWTSGTLFPQSSKKLARAINSASNNRPVVVLANLSGFDGSPESMRRLQLEYGAEIGRAVVNFKGPMVFCVVSRYHGGAYVVFSHALNEHLEVIALEGTYASVIGGAPAAAVVFAGEVDARAKKDPRVEALTQAISQTQGAEKNRLRSEWNELFKVVHSEKLGEMAAEFDGVHSVHRALQVGALHRIIPPIQLRPYLIDAITRGIEKDTAERGEKKVAATSAVDEREVATLQAD